MFYSQHILTKKGPLAKIWLAAHMQSKLTKAMVNSTDVSQSCEKIVEPEAPLALRLSSNLMLGVVRIYSRKTKYLLSDCSEAMAKLKLAFTSGNTTSASQLAEASNLAPFSAITLMNNQLPTSSPSKQMPIMISSNGLDLDLDFEEYLQMDLTAMRSDVLSQNNQSAYQASIKDITMDDQGLLAAGDDLDMDPNGILSSTNGGVTQGGDNDEDDGALEFIPTSQRLSLSQTNSGNITPEAFRKENESEQLGLNRKRSRETLELDDGAGKNSPELMEDGGTARVPLTLNEDENQDNADGEYRRLEAGSRAFEMTPLRESDEYHPLPMDIGASPGASGLELIDLKVENEKEFGTLVPKKRQSKRVNRKRRMNDQGFDIESEIPAKQIRAQLMNTSDLVIPFDQLMLNISSSASFRVPSNILQTYSIVSDAVLSAGQNKNSTELSQFIQDCVTQILNENMNNNESIEVTRKNHQYERDEPVNTVHNTVEIDLPNDDIVYESHGIEIQSIHSNLPSTNDSRINTTHSKAHSESIPHTPIPNSLNISSSMHSIPHRTPSSTHAQEFDASEGVTSIHAPHLIGQLSLTEVANTRAEMETEEGMEMRMNLRTKKMCLLLNEKMKESENENTILFTELGATPQSINRRTAARSFYEILALSSKKVIQVEQTHAYDDIKIVKTDQFSNIMAMI
mmetsp:Transcript_10467/g.18864  ORF Transcript_10467/g.18864 Transcript_10467/m.18864 type:complete len:684 (-) Transcript_10467:644-2695(-)